MSFVFVPPVRYFAYSALLAGLALLSGCDNTACIFGPGNCQEGFGNGDPDPSATEVGTPRDGNRLDAGPPTLLDALPTATDVAPDSPMVLTFSETMNPATLTGAFELLDEITTLPIPLLPATLVADGRVAILLPLVSLPVDATYVLRLADDANVTDVSGQAWEAPTDGTIVRFSVSSLFPEVPQVLATFPADGATGESDLGEITVVFDRPMVQESFSRDSFIVRVNGLASSADPLPLPALTVGAMGPESLTQVWTWANQELGGAREALPVGASMSVTLSPDAALLIADDDDGIDLPETTIDFTLANFSAPVAITKPFEPIDAIGGPDLAGAVPVLQAELATPAIAGDTLELFLFGEDPDGSGGRVTVARTVALTEGVQLVDVLPGQLGLADSSGSPFLGEGDITIAGSISRGVTASAVRLADADPDLPGPQDLMLDTTPPNLVGFGPGGLSLAGFASDQRNLVVVGRADETVAAATVSSSLGDNFTAGEIPPVALAGEDGLFIAAPVLAGQIDPAAGDPTFTIQLYDRAFNVTEALMGSLTPVGGVGPGAPLPGPEVRVRVVSRLGLTPVMGARVMSHRRDPVSGAVTELGAPGFSGADGRVTVPGATDGQTLVSVDSAEFDLFTFDGVPSAELTVVLEPVGLLGATSSGEVQGSFLQASGIFNQTAVLRDSRAGLGLENSILSAVCGASGGGMQIQCPFGPLGVLPGRIGLRSMTVVDEPSSPMGFEPEDYLIAFELGAGLQSAAPGEAEVDQVVELEFTLGLLGDQDQAVALPAHVLNTSAATGLGTLSGDPFVTVEGLTPGLPGPVLVGQGADFSTSATTWAVLAAVPGAADVDDDGGTDELGSLVTQGTLEADLFLRAEVSDVDGNMLVARPRISNSMQLLIVSDVPSLLSPLAGGTTGGTGGAGFNVGVRDVIPDAAGVDGLVKCTVTDSQGRRWHLWTLDPPDTAGLVRIFAPDIATASLGGTPLALGPATAEVAVYSWSSLDGGAFLWSDIEREHELASFAAPISFTVD